MTVNVRQFRNEFPEFRSTDNAVIERGLSDARQIVSQSVWGEKYDFGVKYYAAHIIASGPLGEKARLMKNSDKTTYLSIYERMEKSVTIGIGRNS